MYFFYYYCVYYLFYYCMYYYCVCNYYALSEIGRVHNIIYISILANIKTKTNTNINYDVIIDIK